jgi:alkylation response protein AidB-like acyl-CoA dehydrogenase
MISFELSPEQEMLKKTIRDFAEKEIKPLRQKLDEKEEFSEELTKKMGKLGLFGMQIDPKYGGQELDALSYCIAVEEIARVDGCQAATVAAENALGIAPIDRWGTEQQKQKYLPMLCSGENLWGFGLTEAEAGSDAGNTQTRAVLKNGQWVINGSKIFITNTATPMCAGVTVQAVTGDLGDGKKEISCIIVPSGTPGFTSRQMHHKLTWRSSVTGELYFEDVKVPEENLLGKRGEGFHMMLATLDSGRLGIAAMGVGGAQGAFEAALDYAKVRKTFGKPISKHQAIAFKLADMAVEIEAARNLLYKACWLKDNDKPFAQHASMAKLYSSEVMRRVTHEAIQVFGGYGLMEEYPVAKFFRDQRLLEIGEGSSEVQRIVISRYLGC